MTAARTDAKNSNDVIIREIQQEVFENETTKEVDDASQPKISDWIGNRNEVSLSYSHFTYFL